MSTLARYLAAVGVMMFVLACGLPIAQSTQAPAGDLVWTAVAQTQAVQTMVAFYADATLTALAGLPTQSLPPTETPFPPSPTLTETPSFTPSPTLSPTPENPMISVSVDTNCRTGPGKVYDMVGALRVGQGAEVIGRDSTGNYWYIRDPSNPSSFCWVWGQYATLSGNVGALPIFTPPPTPTPSGNFAVSYSATEVCLGHWFLEFSVTNTGSIVWESFQTTAIDLDHSITKTGLADQFREVTGCAFLPSQDDLAPGESGTVLAGTFDHSPSGEDFRVTIKLCSEDGLGGICVSKTITFTVP